LAKYSLEDKQNPVERKAFKEKMEHLLAITESAPQHIQVWFWDESGFSLRTIRRKIWGRRGRRSVVPGQRRRGRVNIMGGLHFHDRKRHCFIIGRGNGESFLEQLEQLQEFVKKEWIEQGNKAEDFNTKGPLSVIVLDNASYHKRKDIIDSIKKNLPKIHLEFLPAYSPDYNLIELVWHSCKEYIAGRLFKSVEELEELLKSLLNDGKLIIKWGRKLKNKGNMINAT
jgi:transposase